MKLVGWDGRAGAVGAGRSGTTRGAPWRMDARGNSPVPAADMNIFGAKGVFLDSSHFTRRSSYVSTPRQELP